MRREAMGMSHEGAAGAEARPENGAVLLPYQRDLAALLAKALVADLAERQTVGALSVQSAGGTNRG